MTLVDELKRRGFQVRHEGGGNHRLLDHSGLIVKGNFWYSHSLGRGGGSKSLFLELGIIDENGIVFDHPSQYQNGFPKNEPPHHEEIGDHLFDLSYNTIRYLSMIRGIDDSLIWDLQSRDLIKEDHHKNICFMGYDEGGCLRCVSRRSTKTQNQLQKSERSGSDKRYSFSLRSKQSLSELVVAEGPIDILSIACMEHRHDNGGYFRTHKISTCGAPAGNIAKRILLFQPRKVWLSFDNDEAGRNMTQQVSKALSPHCRVGIPQYDQGKDPNDWLMYRRQKETG
jgi:hypothetical protein